MGAFSVLQTVYRQAADRAALGTHFLFTVALVLYAKVLQHVFCILCL